jgi:hypothetical protein
LGEPAPTNATGNDKRLIPERNSEEKRLNVCDHAGRPHCGATDEPYCHRSETTSGS